MKPDQLPSIMQADSIELVLHVGEGGQFDYSIKGSLAVVAFDVMSKASMFPLQLNEIKVELVEPKEFACLTKDETETIEESVRSGSSEIAYLVLQLGIVNQD